MTRPIPLNKQEMMDSVRRHLARGDHTAAYQACVDGVWAQVNPVSVCTDLLDRDNIDDDAVDFLAVLTTVPYPSHQWAAVGRMCRIHKLHHLMPAVMANWRQKEHEEPVKMLDWMVFDSASAGSIVATLERQDNPDVRAELLAHMALRKRFDVVQDMLLDKNPQWCTENTIRCVLKVLAQNSQSAVDATALTQALVNRLPENSRLLPALLQLALGQDANTVMRDALIQRLEAWFAACRPEDNVPSPKGFVPSEGIIANILSRVMNMGDIPTLERVWALTNGHLVAAVGDAFAGLCQGSTISPVMRWCIDAMSDAQWAKAIAAADELGLFRAKNNAVKFDGVLPHVPQRHQQAWVKICCGGPNAQAWISRTGIEEAIVSADELKPRASPKM